MKATLLLATLALTPVAFAQMGPIQPAQGNYQPDRNVRSIAITATARVTNEADVATVHISFQAYGTDKDSAYAAGSKVSNAIVAALKGAGVPKDAIESESQQVQAVQPYELNQMPATERAGKAFHVTQSWTVRANAADGARILDIATRAGANNSGQIDWSLRDPNAANTAAAAKALQQAQMQANAMAAGLNVKLNGLLYASNEVDSQPVRPLMRAMAAAPMMEQKVVEPLAINPRQIETSATVYAVFAIQ